MDADIHTLYESDFYRILDFRCRCRDCGTSKPEYSESFSISFVRKGNFLFNVFRNSLDSYNGCVLITKPGYERTVTHVHTVPDECSIFEFKADFYRELPGRFGRMKSMKDNDLHSILVKTSPEIEYLHFHILRQVTSGSTVRLETDSLVMDFVENVMSALAGCKPEPRLDGRLKKNHLITIERAKEYITSHFSEDISLKEIAENCYVSPFHFSRIFKAFTSYSPHRFLLHLRLKNSETLLKNTSLPVADIAFLSGFNSVEHFTASFRQKYLCPPATFRVTCKPLIE